MSGGGGRREREGECACPAGQAMPPQPGDASTRREMETRSRLGVGKERWVMWPRMEGGWAGTRSSSLWAARRCRRGSGASGASGASVSRMSGASGEGVRDWAVAGIMGKDGMWWVHSKGRVQVRDPVSDLCGQQRPRPTLAALGMKSIR